LLLTLLPAALPAKEIELPQADGSVLTLPRPAERLVTLAPHLAELVFAAGAGDLLVGSVSHSDHPPAVQDLPRVGDAFRIDLERMLALAPDLVIAWDSGNPGPALQAIENLGLPVWRTEVRELEQMSDLLLELGRATGRTATAGAAEQALRGRIGELRERHGGAGPVRYFYQVAERPLYTLNGRHLVSRALALCGGSNVFENLGSLAAQVSREAVLEADPDLMLAGRAPGESGAGPLEAWRAWPRLRAVRSGELHYVDADRMNRATPRMLDSVEHVCDLFDRWRRSANDGGSSS
jgi:iron complex transport system substrate-binding protein